MIINYECNIFFPRRYLSHLFTDHRSISEDDEMPIRNNLSPRNSSLGNNPSFTCSIIAHQAIIIIRRFQWLTKSRQFLPSGIAERIYLAVIITVASGVSYRWRARNSLLNSPRRKFLRTYLLNRDYCREISLGTKKTLSLFNNISIKRAL